MAYLKTGDIFYLPPGFVIIEKTANENCIGVRVNLPIMSTASLEAFETLMSGTTSVFLGPLRRLHEAKPFCAHPADDEEDPNVRLSSEEEGQEDDGRKNAADALVTVEDDGGKNAAVALVTVVTDNHVTTQADNGGEPLDDMPHASPASPKTAPLASEVQSQPEALATEVQSEQEEQALPPKPKRQRRKPEEQPEPEQKKKTTNKRDKADEKPEPEEKTTRKRRATKSADNSGEKHEFSAANLGGIQALFGMRK